MSNGTNSANGKTSKLVLILYIAAGVLGALFIYMFINAINYINSYVSSYGMSFGDMWMDAIQYITTVRSIIWYSVFWCLLQERSWIRYRRNRAKTMRLSRLRLLNP